MILKKWLGRIAGAFAAMGLAGAAPAPAPLAQLAAPASAHPGLWKLQDADTTIYLFGTIHALPDNVAWRTPAFDRAFGSADQLMIEVGNIDDQQAVAGALMKVGMAPGLPPLLERVPMEKRGDLLAAMISSGVPPPMFDGMKSWTAALLLLSAEFKKIGLSPEQGVERKLVAEWKARGRSVDGFETAADQFGFLDSLSPDAQAKLLAAAADKPDETAKQFAAMLRAWEAGDVAAIASTFDDETTMSAELRQVLMKQRNARWTDWLTARMAKPGTVFVAVGAGHLAGGDSVQAMLAARGLKVTRLQ